MEDRIYQFLLTFLEKSKQAIYIYQKTERNPLLANQVAQAKYADPEGKIDVYDIFEGKEAGPFLKAIVAEKLAEEGIAMLYDVETISNQGKSLVCDVQVSYVDLACDTLCVEIFFKEDKRLAQAMSQINQSSRAEGLLALDQELTCLHCNQHFRDVLGEMQGEIHLSLGFQPGQRAELLAEIQQSLETTGSFFQKIQLVTAKGAELWHSLELQRRTLDDSGIDKVMVYLVNIEDQVETKSKLDDLSQYFNIMQRVSNGLLYRLDIENKILYRNDEIASAYQMPLAVTNFPNQAWLDEMVFPEDWDATIEFVQTLFTGQEGTKTVRLRTPEGDFKYHKFTFQAIYTPQGDIKEMLGFATNVHEYKEVENERDKINQYLNVIQKITVCALFRYDIKRKILYRNAEMAIEHGLPTFIENYPNMADVKRAVHPDDVEGYIAFFDKVIAGEEGVFHARLYTVEETCEYHAVNVQAIWNGDGSIHEMLVTVMNEHDLKETENQLSGVNRHYQAMQKLSDDFLFHIDLKTNMFSRHDKEETRFGLTKDTVPFPQALYEGGGIYPEDKWFFEEFVQDVSRGEAGSIEVRMREQAHENFAYRRISWTPIENEKGEVNEVIGKFMNVQAVKDLEEQANYDSLTRALNKRAFAEATTHLLKRSKPGDSHALLFLDLDNFKYVNDNLGHSFGDFLLKKVGARIRESIRYHDIVGRVGGDEFVVVLRDITSAEIFLGKAKLLLSAISQDVVDGDKRHTVQASIGIAVYPDHGSTYEELYHRADLALYTSKRQGKNTVSMYQEGMEE